MNQPNPDSLLASLRIWEERDDDYQVSSLYTIRAMLHEEDDKQEPTMGGGFHRTGEVSTNPEAVRRRKQRAERKAAIAALGAK